MFRQPGLCESFRHPFFLLGPLGPLKPRKISRCAASAVARGHRVPRDKKRANDQAGDVRSRTYSRLEVILTGLRVRFPIMSLMVRPVISPSCSICRSRFFSSALIRSSQLAATGSKMTCSTPTPLSLKKIRLRPRDAPHFETNRAKTLQSINNSFDYVTVEPT